MPLTLITGPANAAKAGAVLERLRAALPRDPLLVVPTAADVEHYQRELAGSGIVFGAEVLTFARPRARDRRRAPGWTPGRSGASRASASCARRSPTSRCGRSRARPRRRASPTRPARCSPSCSARSSRPRGSRPRCARGRPSAGARRTPDELARALLRLPPPARAARAARPRGLRVGGARRAARRARRVGRPARLPLRLRRPHADRSATRSRRCRATRAPTCASRCPTSPAGSRSPAAPRRSRSCARSPPRSSTCPSARSTTRRRRARRCTTSSARCSSRAPARRAAQRRGAAARGGRRARRGRARRRRGARADAPGDRGARHRGAAARRRGHDRAVRAGARRLRDPGQPRPPRRRSAARGSAPACWPARARRCPAGPPRDLLPWLRTPGRLADPAPADALEARVRRGEVAHAPGPRAGMWEQRLGGRAARRARRARRGGGRRAPRRCWTRWRPRPRRSGPRRTAAGPTSSRAEDLADARVAADLRAAVAELRGLAARRPGAARRPHELLEALAAVEVREPSAVAGAALGDARRDRRRPGSVAAARRAARTAAGVLLADPLDDPRAALPRGVRLRAAGRRVPAAGRSPSRSSPTTTGAGSPRPSGLRLPLHEDVLDRERSLFYAAVSRPEDVLFLSWRSSDEEGDPQAPSAFLDDVRALFTDELWEERGTRLLADVTWAPRDAPTPHELRRAYAAARERARAGAAGRAARRRPCSALLAARETEPARGLEAFAACGVRWLIEQLLRPGRTEPDPEPMRRGALAHAVLERTLELLRERTGSARHRAGAARRRARSAGRRAAPSARGAGGPRRRARARCCAAWRPTSSATCAREAECGAGFEPTVARVVVRPRARTRTARSRSATAAGTSRAASTASTSARTARRSCATTRAARSSGGAQVGRRAAAAGRALPARGARAARPGAGRRALPAAGRPQARRPRARARRRAGPLHAHRPRRRGRRSSAALEAARALAARTAADLHAGRLAPVPGALLEPRLPLSRRSAAPASRRREVAGVRSTPEQRAAIADRGRSSLLAAGAGSGKTAVMVERFAEAVLHDGVAVGSILTLTFTEKAAAELRERIRRRFTELGADEHARAVDAAWIGTIHGFCARVLRSQPLAAGLDPRFAVLDEAAARRLAARGVRGARWRRGWPRTARPRSTSPPPTAWDLETMVTRAHARAAQPRRDASAARAPAAGAAARPRAALAAAAAAAAPPRCAARPEARASPPRVDALEACERLLGRRRPASAAPGRARRGEAADRRQGARARRLRRLPRRRGTAYRAACADHHARPVARAPRRAARRVRRRLRGGQGGARGRRLRGPRAARARPARRRRRRCARAGRSASR